MESNDIKNYIKKLEEIEKELMSDNPNYNLLKDIDGVLSHLDNDIKSATIKDFNITSVNIKKLHENATIPSYSKDGDAGMDLTATEIISIESHQITYGTGIAMEIPKGYVGLIFPRSSVRKYDLSLSNSVGVIDSGYRGEIQVTFNKVNFKTTHYNVGDRVAQIIIIPYPKIKFVEVNELTSTDRGEGGFGSTGA